MTYQCKCECHKICHLCGRPFVGNYAHINCMDTADPPSPGYLVKAGVTHDFDDDLGELKLCGCDCHSLGHAQDNPCGRCSKAHD